MLRLLVVGLCGAVVLGLTGCSSDSNKRRQEYLDADYYTRLELPPDLTAPDDSRQLTSPQPAPEAVEVFKRDSAEVGKEKAEEDKTSEKPTVEEKLAPTEAPVVVAPKVPGARLQSKEGVFWLEVDEDINTVWNQLSGFWSHEGIKVVRNEPMLGLVETDWVSKLQVDENADFITRMFQHAEPDKLDKFKMRLEPEENPDKTRIFMSHSGLELIVQENDINWRTRCSEEELELEMLNRLGLYLGLNEKEAEKAFGNYRPYASRVKMPSDEKNRLYVTGTMNFVWKRTLRALDRLGIEIQDMDAEKQLIKAAVKELSPEQTSGKKDEYAESSWLGQWLSGSDEDKQFRIKLEKVDGVIRLDILTVDDKPAETVLAEQFRKALAIELQ